MRLALAILAWLSPLFAVGAAQGQTGEMAKPTTLHVEMVRDSIASGTNAISGSTNGCPTASVEVAGWPRHLLRECEYSAHGLNGFVYLLAIEPARIAIWIESGCGKFVAEHVARLPKADRKFADDATYRRECFRVALELARQNSGMMFPIAGSIIENMGKGPGHYAFRQGTRSRPGFGGNQGMALSPAIAVGTAVASRPPHRSVLAQFTHTALTLSE